MKKISFCDIAQFHLIKGLDIMAAQIKEAVKICVFIK